MKADRGFRTQGTQLWPDLVEQKLPDLAIRQQRELICQHGGEQQRTSKPFHGAVRAHKLSLLFDEFPDGQFLSPFCRIRTKGQERLENREPGTKDFSSEGSQPSLLFLVLRILQAGEQ